MLSRRANLLKLLREGRADWTPCSINIAQWFNHHQRFGTLDPAIADCADHLDVMKRLGMDIFTRNSDSGFRRDLGELDIARATEAGLEGPRQITTVHTPHGDLRAISEQQTAQSTAYQVEDMVKDWPAERDAFWYMLDRLAFSWDRAACRALDARIGEDGLVLASAGSTPLKYLHNTFGLDHACLFVYDEPAEAERIAEAYWAKLRPVLVAMAEADEVHAVILMDNVDTPFYPPPLARTFWTPYVKDAAELMHRHGKTLFVHACGQLAGLIDQFRAAGVDGLEGMAHPPLGDFPPALASQVHDRFIFNGGFTAHEQVNRPDHELEPFYARFFEDLGGYERFIFGAACQTTIHTPFARIRRIVELVRQFGGAPHPEPTHT